ncbi:MAG: DnaA regulatory inactivator Hda [Burkholderiales bacterium]
MEQLVFDLVRPRPADFENFVPGRNAEAVAALERAAGGAAAESGVFLWGPPGCGRTHLLRAAAARARRTGRPVIECESPSALAETAPEPGTLATVDDVGFADANQQARLFTLYNTLRERAGTLVLAADAPPARLALREDVRTRLAWGLVYEIVPLTDDEKPAALANWARSRGYALDAEVVAYLLSRGRRDMRTLVGTLEELDRRSLALKRPITVPLLREWLQRAVDGSRTR